MTWETQASEAKYRLIKPISENYAENNSAAPHTWHASEMFLYITDILSEDN